MAKWDAGRFLNTVDYFEAIPVFSDIKRWLTGESIQTATPGGGRTLGLILVIGGMGEIGQLVIAQLLKAGYRVRAIVSDLASVPFNIPTHLEFVRAELDPLTPQVMQGIQAIITCPDPQPPLSPIAISNLATVASRYLPPTTKRQLFDFTQPDADLKATWGAVDDVVMGGVSESSIRLVEGYAVFSGDVSTENSGGFASVRTRNFEPSFDLSNYTGIELRVKGDGQRYKLFVRTESKWDGVGYARSFDPSSTEWTTIQIPFKELVPIFRAKTVENAPPIDSHQIRSLQVMLSKFEYDRELNPHFTPGLFSLQIESISAYGGKPVPQLVTVSDSANDLVSTLQATNLPYSIVKSGNLDPQMVAMICVKAIAQTEAAGQILGW
jgi:Complex I intermediate-associated protein 30 (CIA30)/NmrA-like family